MWAAYRGDALAAALIVQVMPGRTATILPPRVAPDADPQAAAAIVSHVLPELASRGVCWVQALLESDQGDDVDVLGGAGFQHAAELLYLVSPRSSFPSARPQDGLEFVSYRPEEHPRLSAIVERTYAGSLDCPGLDKVRKIEDVLAGYRAAGNFDPARWLIVRQAGDDVGCLLLCETANGEAWELTYFGLAREARGRGLGVGMARYAQWLARQAGAQRLTAAVDADNWPALAVYAACGFISWDRRSVFLRVL
jgi:ribosomal protein S18 acetylase RimI-like enzyme